MATYFTSDTHFGHGRIIDYSNRPFANVDEMDRTIISNWNAIVRSDDTVYHLGDFAVGGGPAMNYLSALNGHIKFVWGNHDNRLKLVMGNSLWPMDIEHIRHISVEGQRIVLCHYAMKVWDKSHKGAWHLYGHSHGSLPDDPNSLSLDVGVDCWDYKPVSMQQIKERIKHKTWKPVDLHNNYTT